MVLDRQPRKFFLYGVESGLLEIFSLVRSKASKKFFLKAETQQCAECYKELEWLLDLQRELMFVCLALTQYHACLQLNQLTWTSLLILKPFFLMRSGDTLTFSRFGIHRAGRENIVSLVLLSLVVLVLHYYSSIPIHSRIP